MNERSILTLFPFVKSDVAIVSGIRGMDVDQRSTPPPRAAMAVTPAVRITSITRATLTIRTGWFGGRQSRRWLGLHPPLCCLEAALGGDPSYIDFSVTDKPNGDPIFDMALARYRKRQDEGGDHPRSLVESVNNALRMQSAKVRARFEITRECELLARFVVYNIRRAAYLHMTAGRPIAYADERALSTLHDSSRDVAA
jgi:hypothetical protein